MPQTKILTKAFQHNNKLLKNNRYSRNAVLSTVSQKWAMSNIMFTKLFNHCHNHSGKVKVKQSHYRPGQALRVPGGWGPQISRQFAHEGGKVVSPTHRPPLPPRKCSWYSFLLVAESIPGPLCSQKDYVNEKIPITISGIEPVPFRLVAQCLNQLRHRVAPDGNSTFMELLKSRMMWG